MRGVWRGKQKNQVLLQEKETSFDLIMVKEYKFLSGCLTFFLTVHGLEKYTKLRGIFRNFGEFRKVWAFPMYDSV